MMRRSPQSLYPQPQNRETPEKTLPGFVKWLLLWVLAGIAVGALITGAKHLLPAVFSVLLQQLVENWWAALIGFIFSVWPHVLLHEAGHALAGRLFGMQLLVAGIGAWRMQKMNGRWQCFRLKDVAGTAGFAAMAPAQEQAPSRAGLAIFMLGGVAANFASAALLWYLRPDALGSPIWHALIIGASLQALFLGLINLLPIVSKGWLSDGKQLLILLRDPQEADRYLTLQRLAALSLAGVRPRDWPQNVRPLATLAKNPSMIARLLDIAHAQWRMDSGKGLDDAAFWQRIVKHHTALGEGYRQYAALAMTQYAACHLHDADLLEAWLVHCEGGLIDFSPQRAVSAALLASLQGRHEQIPRLIHEARALLPRSADPASRLLLEEILTALEENTLPS